MAAQPSVPGPCRQDMRNCIATPLLFFLCDPFNLTSPPTSLSLLHIRNFGLGQKIGADVSASFNCPDPRSTLIEILRFQIVLVRWRKQNLKHSKSSKVENKSFGIHVFGRIRRSMNTQMLVYEEIKICLLLKSYVNASQTSKS